MSDEGVNNVSIFDDDDFDQPIDTPTSRGNRMSYDDLKRLALDCEVVIGRHERTIAQLRHQIQTHECTTTSTSNNAIPSRTDNNHDNDDTDVGAGMYELQCVVQELKKENALLSENEAQLRDKLDIQRKERRAWKSKKVDALKKQLQTRTNEVVSYKMVIKTLKQEVERLSASKSK